MKEEDAGLLAHWRREIETFYLEQGYDLGWQMFGTPAERTLTAEFGVLGVNPAAGTGEADDVCWDQPGNHITDSGYDLRFLKQNRLMVEALGLGPEDFFYAQFVPFRSTPNYTALPNHGAAYTFSLKLWSSLYARMRARVLICNGKMTGEAFGLRIGGMDEPIQQGPFSVYRDGSGRTVVQMPHLSWRQLFSGPKAAQNIENLRDIVSAK